MSEKEEHIKTIRKIINSFIRGTKYSFSGNIIFYHTFKIKYKTPKTRVRRKSALSRTSNIKRCVHKDYN